MDGRLILARNAFLGMPSYFKGRPIRTFIDLIGPSPLISLYVEPGQYIEFVARQFNVAAWHELVETYDELPQNGESWPTRTIALDCRAAFSDVRPAQPVNRSAESRAHLERLGAEVRWDVRS